MFTKLRKLLLLICIIAGVTETFLPKANAQTCATKVPIPEVIPLPGIPFLNANPFKLASCFDVKVEEYILTGTATSYKQIGEPDKKGRWHVEEAGHAPYTTRIVVIRPNQPEKFNGTVVVEWLNVTGGFDFSPARNMMWRELAREGSVWVGVSAQVVGVQGGQSLSGMNMSLKKLNPERYKQLNLPGDAFSYDIYSQAGRFLKSTKATVILGGLIPKHLISMGESQSAFYLTTYINAIDPVVQVYDGFLNYSRFGFAAPLEGTAINSGWLASSKVVKMRRDLRVPVMIFVTETDVVGLKGMGMMSFKGFQAARQRETNRLRIWEVAGTAHSDSYLSKVSAIDTCNAQIEKVAAAFAPSNEMMPGMKLKVPFNNAPQHHYVVQAAIVALEKWVATGKPPVKATPIELVGAGTSEDPVRAVRDEYGNVKGGIRSPWLDVPTSCLSGSSTDPGAGLSGSVEPFDAAKLDSLYPGGVTDYLSKFEAALDKQINAGFILKADKDEIMELAKLSYKGSK